MASIAQNQTQTSVQRTSLQARYRLVIIGVAVALLALLSLITVVNAYRTSFNLFESIAVFYGTKVDASQRALQYISRTSQATADYTALSSDTPLYEQAVNDIFRNFNLYRDEMFILRSNLQTPEEEAAFVTADTFTYSRFWRHVGNLIDGRSDVNLARREYLSADNNLRNRIIPALESLESENFELMVAAGDRAGSQISVQIFLVAITTLSTASLLTYLSFWLRAKVRRYLTPGIDAALVIAWLVPILVLLELMSLPGQINTMTQDAYNSISGTSRALVVGNLANRAESSAIIDTARTDYWFSQFDKSLALLEERLCGLDQCSAVSFLSASGNIDTNVLQAAQSVTKEGDVKALVANVSFTGEARALENARIALQDFLAAHHKLMVLIVADDLGTAIEINTGMDDGDSEAAFRSFATAMAVVESLNREVFDDIWQKQQTSLPRNQIVYGIAANLAVVLLVAFGVNRRFREL